MLTHCSGKIEVLVISAVPGSGIWRLTKYQWGLFLLYHSPASVGGVLWIWHVVVFVVKDR